MLEKPKLNEVSLIDTLLAAYNLQVVALTFLALEADTNTAVYQAVTKDSTPYFVKLRSGKFDPMSVALPKFLSDKGVNQIIAPMRTRNGELWSRFAGFTLILYPFISGNDAFSRALMPRQWYDFGTAIKQLHSVKVPPTIKQCLAQETFSMHSCQAVRTLLTQYEANQSTDPTVRSLFVFLNEKGVAILNLVERTEMLVRQIQAQPLPLVVCHSDLHAGNLLLTEQGELYIVDWDNLILAPKERDLMFIGGGQGFSGVSAAEEIELFYRGYGEVQINHAAIAYYRCERIVQDIALFCSEILSPETAYRDRQQALHYLIANFHSGGTIEIAQTSDSK